MVPKYHLFENGVWFDFAELIPKTLTGFMEYLVDTDDLDPSIMYEAQFCGGYDGAGSFSVYRNSSSGSPNQILVAMRLMKIVEKVSGQLVYVEKSMGPDTEIPIAIIPGKESHDLVKAIGQKLETEVLACQNQIFDINGNDKTFQFSFKFEPSQCDKKLFLDLSGAGGGYCLHCNTTMEDAQNQDLIVEGFPMDRNIKDLNERFQELDSKGLIDARKKGDYSQRTGLTHEPIWKELDPTKYIPVLHAWINALKLFERLCYLQNSRKSFPNEWPKTGPGIRLSKEAKLAQDTAKKVFSAQAKATMKLTLNMADIGGTSGNSDTGNNAREFFSAKNREKVLDLYDFHGNDRDSLRDLLQRWNVVLRVQSSIELIDVPDFVDYCKETYIKTKDLFPWHTIPGAMHAVLAHSPQQIQSNGGYGLGQKSESPLESLHYFMRIFEKYQSRKISTEACLYDTMKRLYLKSCQLVRSQRLEKKPAKHEISFLSQDDKIVQSFFISNQIEE